MIRFYFSGGPNPRKVALFLEEAGVAYDGVRVDTLAGEQYAPDFLALNPNAKVPVIVDEGQVIFDSNAILLYLADTRNVFLAPRGTPAWSETLSWLMFVASGVGPYAGQAVHFRHASPLDVPYAMERYQFEAARHFSIIEDRLRDREYLVGDSFSIVDMALWGWASFLPRILGEEAASAFPRVAAFVARIDARPAALRALAVTGGQAPAAGKVKANPNLFRYLATAQE